MLHPLHSAIVTLLADRGQIPPAEVDVWFEIPAREWVESLARPAICCYLFDLAESAEFRNASAQTVRANGKATTRLPPRRVDLRYLVCAFSSSRADEQALVWRALAALLRHTTLPPELLAPELRELGVAVQTKVGTYQDAPRLLDLWGALELPPRPALLYTVTAPLDLAVELEAPLVLTRLVRSTRTLPEDERAGRALPPADSIPRAGMDRDYEPVDLVRVVAASFSIAGIVRDRGGEPVAGVTVRAEGRTVRHERGGDGPRPCRSDAEGRYRIDNLARGPVTLLVARPGAPARAVRVEVPGLYDLTVD
jgi:hypothetical protein